MGIWVWVQPGLRLWKVISDYQAGTICVYDENGEILLEKRGLTKEVISIMESNFFDLVATKQSEKGSEKTSSEGNSESADHEIPMYG